MAVTCALLWIIFSLSEAAITSTPNSISECNSMSTNLKWAYEESNILVVEWNFNGNLMLQYIPSQTPPNDLQYSSGYTSAKVGHISNGEINISSLTTSDSGSYSCKTTYSLGSPLTFETQLTLTVSDMISTNLTCSYNQSTGIIDCSVIPSSITSVTINGHDHLTSSLPINGTESNTYSICMAGEASNCRNDGIQQCITVEGESRGPTSQMTTYLASERTTSDNSIFEFSNMTLLITGSTTPTSDISASTTRYLYTYTTYFSAHTESTIFYSNILTADTSYETGTPYANTETSNLNANIETIIYYENTKTANVFANTKTFESHSLFTSYSMFVTAPVSDIQGSFDTTIQNTNETLPPPVYSISTHNGITIQSTFGTSNVFPETCKETSISLSVVTRSDISSNTLHISSGSLIITDTSKYAIVSMAISSPYVGDSYIYLLTETEQNTTITTSVSVDSSAKSPWMSATSIIDQISFSSDILSPSFSSTDTNDTLTNNSVNNEFPLSIIDSMMHLFVTSHLDDTDISLFYSTTGYHTFSKKYVTAVSTSFMTFSQSIDHYFSSQTTDNQITVQEDLISSVTELNTDSFTSAIFSTTIFTTDKSYVHTIDKLSDTKFESENDNQVPTNDFQSTFSKHYSQPTDLFFSSEKPDIFLSTFQSTSSLLPINTKTNGTSFSSNMKTTNMQTIDTKSCMLKTDSSLFISTSSIQNFSVLSKFKTTLLTTRIHSDNLSIPSMITPSFKQTNSDNLYFEIDTSLEGSLISVNSYYASHTSNKHIMISLSSIVFKSVSTLSTSTVQSRLSEKTKTIIFISTASGVLVIIVIILIIVFARMYMSKHSIKPRIRNDALNSSNDSRSFTTAFPDYVFTKKNAYPILNTAAYKNNWNHVV